MHKSELITNNPEKKDTSNQKPLKPILTENQRQLLELRAKGLSYRAIASMHEVSEEYINAQITKPYGVYARLGVNSLMSAIVHASRLNELDLNTILKDVDLTTVFTLTTKEVDVLEGLTRGENISQTALAKELGVAPVTVNHQLDSSARKLGVNKTEAQVVFLAVRDNLERTNELFNQKKEHHLFPDLPQKIRKNKEPFFSERRISILSLLAQGKDLKEIAETVDMEYQRVRNVISEKDGIYDRLQVADSTSAVIVAFEKKLIVEDDIGAKDLSKFDQLTPNQLILLEALIRENGRYAQTHEIAGFLKRSPSTIKTRLSLIYEKLGTANRTQTAIEYYVWKKEKEKKR